MKKKKQPILKLYEESKTVATSPGESEESETVATSPGESQTDNAGESESQESNSALLGDVTGNQTGNPEPSDPVAASEEILKNLSDFKEELLTGTEETDKPKRRRRRTKAEIEREKEAEQAAIVVPPELFVFVCDNGTAHGFALIDKLITRKGKPTINPDQISLRPEQSEKLLPVAQKCIEALKLSDDPVRAFFGSLLAIQFTNYLMIKSTMK